MDKDAENYQLFLETGKDSYFADIVLKYKDGLLLFINTYVVDMAAAEDLSVRQIEKLVKAAKEPPKKPATRTPKTADEKRVEEDLKNALGTRVRLNRKGKKGKIEIEFYSADELERLIELLKTLG